MSAHTKVHPTRKRRVAPRKAPVASERSIPWREVAKKNIEKHTEPGLMLRGARHKADMTQKEAAAKLGIHTHHISEMEHGKRPIGKAMAQKMGRVFNISYKIFL